MAEDPNMKDIRARMSRIKHKILVLSGKGGVGKSTVSSQLALLLASKGLDVGLLDLDICGPSIPRMMGLEGHDVHQSAEGWSPVYVEEDLGVMSIGFLLPKDDDAIIWRGPKKNGLIKQFLMDVCWGDLDVLIIDTPPGTSDEHISITQYLELKETDGAVIVTTPQMVAINDVKKELNFCVKTKTPIIGVVENMAMFVCPNCSHSTEIFNSLHGGAKAMCQKYGQELLGSVPLEPSVGQLCEEGKSVVKEKPESASAKKLSEIGDRILQKLSIKVPEA